MTKNNAARTSHAQETKLQEDAMLAEVVPLIQRAGDSGITLTEMKERLLGDAKPAKLTGRLKALVNEGVIHGPVKYAPPPKKTKEDFYFAAGRGPSAARASVQIVRIVKDADSTLPSEKSLKAAIGIDGAFFEPAIAIAVKNREVLVLTCGKERFYLHRDVAVKHFGLAQGTDRDELTFEEFLQAYRRLKDEQDGISAVKIFDLLRVLEVPKEVLHKLIRKESAPGGRVSIHHSTAVVLPKEVIDAGIRMERETEAFVTVVVKRDR
jgi:hypothetical protein